MAIWLSTATAGVSGGSFLALPDYADVDVAGCIERLARLKAESPVGPDVTFHGMLERPNPSRTWALDADIFLVDGILFTCIDVNQAPDAFL